MARGSRGMVVKSRGTLIEKRGTVFKSCGTLIERHGALIKSGEMLFNRHEMVIGTPGRLSGRGGTRRGASGTLRGDLKTRCEGCKAGRGTRNRPVGGGEAERGEVGIAPKTVLTTRAARAKIRNQKGTNWMKRYLQNVTDMGTNVSVFMKKNQTIWQANAAITTTMGLVDGDLATLAGVDTKVMSPIVGPAADKSVAKFDLENKLVLIGGQIAALGAANNDHTLEQQGDVTLSGLDKMKEADLIATATRIANLATANLTALADYGVTAANVTELSNLATTFGNLQAAPRQAVVDRKKENAQFPAVGSHLLSVLRRQLDRQMLTFKQTQPEFYAGYLGARVIVDRGNPKKKKTAAPAAKPQ